MHYTVYSHVVVDSIELSDGSQIPDQLGGAGTYAAAGAALVASSGEVGLVSGVGSDFPAGARQWLEAAGIDARGLVVTDPLTPHTKVVYAADGTRVESPLYGQAHFRAADPDPLRQPEDYEEAYGIYVFLTADDPMWEAISSGDESKVLLWEIDAASCSPSLWDEVSARSSATSILSINREELASLAATTDVGAALRKLHQVGFDHVVLRLGSDGALVSTPKRVWRALPPAGRVVDPTGAGNAFSGAYLVAWTTTGDCDDALRSGMAAAALTIAQHGPCPVGPATRAHLARIAKTIEVDVVTGRHHAVSASGALEPFGPTVSPLNQSSLRRFGYIDNIPLRGFLIDGRPALTRIEPTAIGDYVLLTVRDPLCDYDDDPATQIAAELDDAELVGRSGMFTTYTGTFRGTRVSVVSGGSGGPEVELAMQELLEYTGATTFVRVGGSGGMHPSVRPGDLVIASGIVRDEGLTASYVPTAYPAACDPEIVLALTEAAHGADVPYHVGTIRSADSDYVGGGRPSVAGYFQPWHEQLAETWVKAGILNGDRESAAIVTMARLFGRRGGSVCSVADNLSTGEAFRNGAGHGSAIRVALEGMHLLHLMDQAKAEAGLTMWIPSLGRPGSA